MRDEAALSVLARGRPDRARERLRGRRGGRPKGSADPAAGRWPEAPARSVRVQEFRGDGAVSESSYTGVVRARYESDLAFRVGGKVVSRYVELGQGVRAGQPLFRLDPEDYELALKAAEADLAAAEAEVKYATAEDDRLRRLWGRRAASIAEFEKGRADRDVAVGRRDRAVKGSPWPGIGSPTAPWRPTPTGS